MNTANQAINPEADMIGRTIIVADRSNFYFGRSAVVKNVSTFSAVTIYTVAVGNITFQLRSDEAE